MLAWPLDEALLALEARMRDRVLDVHRFRVLLYSIGGGKQKPKLPGWLEDELDDEE